MKLHHLRPAKGAKKARTRVGRGRGGPPGKKAGRGMKGTGARGTIRAGFEGGQMPLIRRIPKLKGFKNPNRVEFAPVNVEILAKYFDEDVTPEALYRHGLAHKGAKIKVLARGELDKKLVVKAHAFSKAAKQKIEAAGGTAEVLS
jgi:large subunit ribosomal protein L15